MDNYKIRSASTADIVFIVETIIQSEKSKTNTLGFAKMFNLSEQNLGGYLSDILAQEIDGTGLSINSYLVAEANGKTVAAIAGWVEGANEEGLPSTIITANMISYFFPKESLYFANRINNVVRELQIERELGVYQIDSAYVEHHHRGNNLSQRLIEAHEIRCRDYGCSKMHLQVFGHNYNAIHIYEKCGFKQIKTYSSDNPEVLNFYPSDKKILMQKIIN